MPAPLDDHALVAAAQDGDRDALDRLLRHHYDRIHAVCRRITGNESDANDAAQEALIAVVRGLPRFDGRSSFATWVYRIATNASLDELRRRRRRPIPAGPDTRSDGHGSGPDGSGPHGDVADRHPDLHAATPADRLADRLAIEAALLTLPEEFRVPVVLRDVADLDYAEIADVLHVPIGTVKSRIARGRGQLAATLSRTDLYPSGNPDDPSERPTRTTGQSLR
jgi:RNA polymerase sigma-70 factor (ECF subfamily)